MHDIRQDVRIYGGILPLDIEGNRTPYRGKLTYKKVPFLILNFPISRFEMAIFEGIISKVYSDIAFVTIHYTPL